MPAPHQRPGFCSALDARKQEKMPRPSMACSLDGPASTSRSIRPFSFPLGDGEEADEDRILSDRMGAVVTAVIAIAAVVLGWITIEMACKPCLDSGRRALDRALDPNYDPDQSNSTASEPLLADVSVASAAAPAKAI
ncbi:hypothetical protein GUJ93_ZPchr0013g37432 [Zizania palustris]|uniref:Uncharacterized protein n=1 Tax=Zizania palustris TaxID=103762 RepID=A0A8J5X307_ZIZPA|nr:hypothetical protein GUJ93_ZPchr0013g37432 [Zizania palustris]